MKESVTMLASVSHLLTLGLSTLLVGDFLMTMGGESWVSFN